MGGFPYFKGLEAGVEYAGVTAEATAPNWLSDQLHLSLARSDLAVLPQPIPAWRACDLPRLQQLNDWVLHTRETSEMRAQAEQMGCSLTDWLRKHDGSDPALLAVCAERPPPPTRWR